MKRAKWRKRRIDGSLATGRDWPGTGGSVVDTGDGFVGSAWTSDQNAIRGAKTETAAKRAVERWLARSQAKTGKREGR